MHLARPPPRRHGFRPAAAAAATAAHYCCRPAACPYPAGPRGRRPTAAQPDAANARINATQLQAIPRCRALPTSVLPVSAAVLMPPPPPACFPSPQLRAQPAHRREGRHQEDSKRLRQRHRREAHAAGAAPAAPLCARQRHCRCARGCRAGRRCYILLHGEINISCDHADCKLAPVAPPLCTQRRHCRCAGCHAGMQCEPPPIKSRAWRSHDCAAQFPAARP